MTSVLAWASVIALAARVSTGASVFLCALTGISFLAFLACYVYLFMNDREALRAERWRKRPTAAFDGLANSRSLPTADQAEYLAPERAAATLVGASVSEKEISSSQTTRTTFENQ
jgi:hypothetical protein